MFENPIWTFHLTILNAKRRDKCNTSSAAYLSSSWVILCDGVVRSDQQRAGVSPHSQTLW